MGKDQIFFGRNVIKEALAAAAPISEIFIEKESVRAFLDDLFPIHKPVPVRLGLPKEIRHESHQGIAFRSTHSFYVGSVDWNEFRRVLLCNHLEDIQNLGALARSAVAFEFDILVHESSRSSRLTPAAVKASAGLAFHLRFHEVSNLAYLAKNLKNLDFEIVGLEASEFSRSLYEWTPQGPFALCVGSEASGFSKTLCREIETFVKIPMNPKVESLNAAQAASIAMSWTSRFSEPKSSKQPID